MTQKKKVIKKIVKKKTSQRKPAKAKDGKPVSVVKKKPCRVGENHKRGMSDRAWKFCHEFVKIGVRYLAAISAGYAKKSAYNQANRLMKNENVVNKISELREKLSKKMEISTESVLREYAKLGYTDLTDVVDMSTGSPIFKDLEAIDPKYLGAIQAISVDQHGRLKVKMHDKKGALDSLGKNLDLFAADNKREVELTVGNIKKSDVKKVKDIFDKITE